MKHQADIQDLQDRFRDKLKSLNAAHSRQLQDEARLYYCVLHFDIHFWGSQRLSWDAGSLSSCWLIHKLFIMKFAVCLFTTWSFSQPSFSKSLYLEFQSANSTFPVWKSFSDNLPKINVLYSIVSENVGCLSYYWTALSCLQGKVSP